MTTPITNRPVKNHSKKSNGFTLTELIVTIGILGVMCTFAVVAFGRNKNEEKLKLASKTVFQYLKDAQVRSQQALEPCRVVIDHSNFEISIDNSSECDNLATVDLKDTIKGLSLSDLKICGTATISNTTMACDSTTDGSVDSNGDPTTETQIIFTPRGTVSQGGLLKLYSEKVNRTRCIAVTSPIGMIREGRANDADCDFNVF